MKKNLISVIISLYNKEQWIASTIQSVLDQTYQNFELIIINDGSTDKSLEVASGFKDKRIKIYSIDNGGVSHARNYGIKKSNGKYIAFLDADDTWFKTHLEQLLDVSIKNNAEVSCDKYISNKTHKKGSKTITIIDNIVEYYSKSIFPFHLCSTLIKTKLLEKNNLFFEESLTIGEDLNFLIKINQYNAFYLLDAYGLYYNREDDNSVMNNIGATYRKFPQYFKGVNLKSNKDIQIFKNKFLKNEYYKLAFQNRTIKFTKEEWKINIIKPDMPIYSKIIHLFIRFAPKFIIYTLKKIKPY